MNKTPPIIQLEWSAWTQVKVPLMQGERRAGNTVTMILKSWWGNLGDDLNDEKFSFLGELWDENVWWEHVILLRHSTAAANVPQYFPSSVQHSTAHTCSSITQGALRAVKTQKGKIKKQVLVINSIQSLTQRNLPQNLYLLLNASWNCDKNLGQFYSEQTITKFEIETVHQNKRKERIYFWMMTSYFPFGHDW